MRELSDYLTIQAEVFLYKDLIWVYDAKSDIRIIISELQLHRRN